MNRTRNPFAAPFGDDVNAAIMAHAARSLDTEICGIVVARGERQGWRYRRMDNKAAGRADRFEIDSAALVAQGPVAAIVHSHPHGPAFPSAADMRQQAATAIPWGIAVPPPHPDSGLFWFGTGIAYPLMVRPYRHGVTDCYALIRDWFAAEHALILADRPRDWDWWSIGGDLYASCYEQAGFLRLPNEAPLQQGDIGLAALRSPVLNHALLLLDGGLVLHHPAGNYGFDAARLPRREPVERWYRHIRFWIRHRSLQPKGKS